MKKSVVLFLVCAAFLLLQCVELFGQEPQSRRPVPPIPSVAGIHWAKGQAPPNRGGSPANMSSHGGKVMGSAVVQPIFWGPSWGNANFVYDKISGLEEFYGAMGSSARYPQPSGYARTTDEYYDSTRQVGTDISYSGYKMDLSQAANGSQTTPILTEVCKSITPVPNGFYPVYVDVKRGNAGYCAWHSVGICNGTQVQFAFFFNLDGDAGCDPQDTSGLHSQGMAALANVSGHEISEARTDPALNAWYDNQGNENADKCAWSFGTPLLTFADGSQWKVQGNWSNNAYTNGTGYPNAKGQKGCIDGGNFK